MTLPSRTASAFKNKPWMLHNTNERNWKFDSFRRRGTNVIYEPFIFPQENDHSAHSTISPKTNYLLRINGHTTTKSGGAGLGLILEDSDTNEIVWSARIYVSGDRSPIEAEYSAIIMGMDYVCNMLDVRRLTILSGNEIVVNHVQGIFNVTKSSLETLLQTIDSIQRRLHHFAVKQIPSTENIEATAQAVKALATRKSLNINDVRWNIERKDPIQKLERNPHKMGRWRQPDIPAQSTIIDPSRVYRLQFDGGAARGHVGAGMVLYDDNGTEIWCGWHYHPEAVSNNVAEYIGLICGLRCAQSLGVSKLLVEGDSLLVVQQMTGSRQRTRERVINAFREEACGLAKCFSQFQIRYIPRAENKRADWLANHAMNLQESDGFARISSNDDAQRYG